MLVSPPIMRSPNLNLPFEIMCDASDYAIGAVLGQREDKKAFVKMVMLNCCLYNIVHFISVFAWQLLFSQFHGPIYE